MSQGDSALFVESMDNDFRWTVSSAGRWSKTYGGKSAVLKELFPLLRSKIEGRIKMTAHRFVAEGDMVVVEATGNNATKDGKSYNNRYCFVFELSGGKLRQVTEYMDTELAAEALGHP